MGKFKNKVKFKIIKKKKKEMGRTVVVVTGVLAAAEIK